MRFLRTPTLLVLGALALSPFAPGCGGSADTQTGSTSTGGTGGTKTSSAAGGAPVAINLGYVAVFIAHPHGYLANAMFPSAMGSPGVFSTATFGPCQARVYETLPALGESVYESAGVIAITGGTSAVTLVPDATAWSGYATVESSTADLFTGGETITVTAAGAMVPAFTATVVAPVSVDLLTPLEPTGSAPLPLDRTKDLTLTWNNGGAGSVNAIIGDETRSLTCTFPSAGGTGTVPAAALSTLTPVSLGEFSVSPVSVQTLTAGDMTVRVVVGRALTWNGVVDPQTVSYQAMN